MLDLNDHGPYAPSFRLSLSPEPHAAGLLSGLSYRGEQRDTMRTVLIISAVVFVVGLADDNATLAIIGGAGCIYSLAQSNQLGFRRSAFRNGLQFAGSGPVSLGLNGLSQGGLSHEQAFAHPGAYVQASFKF
jgi:hypothetical protein